MSLTYLERQEMNALSKQVFGTSSRWAKIVRNGSLEPMERDREVMVPDHKGGFKKKTFTDRKSVMKRYTAEEVKKLMLDILESRKTPSEGITPGTQAEVPTTEPLFDMFPATARVTDNA